MILLTILVGLILRLISINQSFWLDEATSGVVVRNLSFTEILTQFSPNDVHPPLYYLVLKAWSLIFGTGEIALRGLSVFSGIITIYVVYLVSKEVKMQKPYIAPLLLATSGLHIYYSQEARMYSLASLFVILTFYFFVKIVKEKKGRIGEWVKFGTFLALAFFTHYLTVLMIPVYWVIALVSKKDKPWLVRFVASHIILLFPTLLYYPTILKQVTGGAQLARDFPLWGQVVGTVSLKEILLVPIKFTLGRIDFDNNLAYLLVALVSLTVVGFLVFKSLKRLKDLYSIYVWLLTPIAIGILLALFIPVFDYYRFLFALPAFYLVLATGISESRNRVWLVIILIINIFSSLYYLSNSSLHREDWKSLVSFVESNRKADSQVLFVANSQMEAYSYYAPEAKVAGPKSFNYQVGQVWLLSYVKDIFDPNDRLRNEIETSGFVKMNEYSFRDLGTVSKYEKSK